MNNKKCNRRKFIRNSTLAIVGSQIIGREVNGTTSSRENTKTISRIKDYKILGKTGFRVSDLAAGAPTNEAVLRAFLESGVNYIDAGEAYENGNREKIIGRVLKDFDRKKIFITSKLLEENGFFKSREDVIARTRKVLERLESDYVDCVLIHGIESTKYLNDPAFHDGMEVMKAEGRVRYTGISCHGSAWIREPEDSLETILMTAIDDGRFDVFMMTYNFVNAPVAEKILAVCEEKGIGTVIMKSNPVMLYQALDNAVRRMEESDRDPGEEYRAWRDRYRDQTDNAREFFRIYDKTTDEELIEAAFAYVLSNPGAHTVCLDLKNLTEVEKYVALSGSRLEPAQAIILDNYLEHYGFLNCRMGCNECEKACPHHLPVNTIMRYNYYFQNKKQEKEAMQLYAKLAGKSAGLCEGCAGYCEEACPYGVNTRRLLSLAHQNLSFNRQHFVS